MSKLVPGIVAVGIAFGLGAWWGRQEAPKTAEKRADPAPAMPCPVAESVPQPSAPTIIAAPVAAAVLPAQPTVKPSPGVAALGFENTHLRQQVASFEAKLDATRRDTEATQGLPLAPPTKLAPRFAQDTLRDSVTRALSEAGLAGTISSVDCTEYPCIVYGEGKGGPGEFRRLWATNAMRGYSDDSHNAFGWSMGDGTPDHPRHDYLGLAIYPRDDSTSRGDELRKRLKFRSSEMAATFEKP